MPESTDSATGRRGAWLRGPVLPCTFAFLLAFALYTRHNDFPLGYHGDEVTKVEHVREGTNRFFHPLLMLTAARLATTGEATDARIVRTGRTVSALFAAIGIAAMAGAACLRGGARAAWSVGIVSALSHSILLHAHYMKEDAALLGGLGLGAWALAWFVARPSRASAALLGGACAVAGSAKYIGLVWLLPAMFALRAAQRSNGGRLSGAAIAWFLGVFAGLAALINYPALLAPRAFADGLRYESFHIAAGHAALRTARLSVSRLSPLAHEIAPPVLVAALAWGIWTLAAWRRRKPFERFMVLFPVGYFALLSVATVTQVRYLLPVVLWAHYLAGRAIADWPRRIAPPRRAAVLTLALLGIVAAPQALRVADYLDQIAHDSRGKLCDWAAENLPPGAVILQDLHMGLPERLADPTTGRDTGIRTVEAPCVLGRLKTIGAARACGNPSYIATSPLTWQRYFDPAVYAVAERREALEGPRAFYDALFENGRLLYCDSAPTWTRAFTNPPVQLYKLPERDAEKPAASPPREDMP